MSSSAKLYSFPKAEKLCSKTLIESIYNHGQKLKLYPFVVNYLYVEDNVKMPFPLQILISVPKRKIKLAVKRNRLKRQIREAYRLNKQPLIDHIMGQDQKMALFLVYIGKENESYSFIEKKLILLLKTLKEDHKKKRYEN